MIQGLHHVTATVTDAREDLEFYTALLGLRLVKKTVNFDNTGVYHLYYGNQRGTPSTLMTTFPYGGQGVPVGTHGAGQIGVTSFSVPAGSLEWWRGRFDEYGTVHESSASGLDAAALTVSDPSGLRIELVEAEGDDREPWAGGEVPVEAAIRGLHGVSFPVHEPEPSLALLTGILGGEIAGRDEGRTRVALGGGGPGSYIDVIHDSTVPRGVNGLGTVHHVAMSVPGSEEQLTLRGRLVDRGYSVTEVKDRQYFQSIYFREPAGVLYEIATAGPGFTVDEDVTRLGEDLKLPPWEESRREAIEANLPPLE